MKICSYCDCSKTLDAFGIDRSKKDGLTIYCKDCSKKKSSVYRQQNPDKFKKSLKNWRNKNQSKRILYRKKYYQNNKSKESIKSKEYREANKNKIAKKEKEYREQNRETYLNKKKQYFQKYKNKHAKYVSERRRRDPTYKLLSNLRRRVSGLLKGLNKSEKTLQLTGCSMEELWVHLERQFTQGMTKENHGKYGWHVDHIRPCSSFDLSDIEQQKLCFHYTNLQPLWAKDNIKKSNK